MSADNYNVIRYHPRGGYTYVMAFASDEDPDLSVSEDSPQYRTLLGALRAADEDYTEYGTSVHSEVSEG